MNRTCVLAAAAAIAAAGCTASSAGTTANRAVAPPMRVGCREVIDQVHRPFAGGYRRVLGVIAAPPAHIPQVVRTDDPTWPFWEKSGMVIRAGSTPIDVRVPAKWRNRAAVTWGNGRPPASAIRFTPCSDPSGRWNAYAGGFLMKTRGACIPLVFEVAGARQVVRFGIGVQCGATR
jgi:hypothetical protein